MGTQLPKQGAQEPPFLAHVYCGQTARWIKMPLDTEVGLDPGDIVLHRHPATPMEVGTATPTFRPMSAVAKWSPISATVEFLFSFSDSEL